MGFRLFLFASCLAVLTACNPSKQIAKSAQRNVLQDSSLKTAHVGISIYEPATGKYWYNYQGDKYFVPASNTKLSTCYAAMKYLGDSLVAMYYKRVGTLLFIRPTADPTFLHPDFEFQPALDLLKNDNVSEIYVYPNNTIEPLGDGWSWNDYDQDYMAERSTFPIYGNVVRISEQPIYPKNLKKDTIIDVVKFLNSKGAWIKPKYFKDKIFYDSTSKTQRKQSINKFYLSSFPKLREIPFLTDNNFTAIDILIDLLNKKVSPGAAFVSNLRDTALHSQPTDSLLKPMMHRSDNFFAEQTLLMVSNARLKIMNDEKIIDTLLKTDLKDLPQKPNWVDGCGLSRYDLFTPQDFVAILNKIKTEFGMERIKNILATGGEGTISSYYKADKGYIFAKTGTLSGVVALSGYLYTKKNKLLIFSVLVNNHQSSATAVRRAVERFIKGIRENY